jgi:putative Mg2+ transporter-C (MgtC) family protein
MEVPSQWAVILATAYAMLLGGVVGLERELKRRPAGFRTHMLVAGAAALLLGIGRLFVGEGMPNVEALQIDPLRLVEAVVAGVAFIGAGTIFSHRSGRLVEGITTAASLLMVAVIGIAAGLGYHLLAFAATALTLVVLVVLRLFERRFGGASRGADPPRP